MRVLLVHNFYRQPGGEDAVVRYQQAMLTDRGHAVSLFAVHNDDIRSVADHAAAFLFASYNPVAKWRLLRRIREFKPDVVHVHNFVPQLSPSVFDACRVAGVPSVLTLHNFRILCPTSFLYYDREVRERSLRHACWWTIPKRVYHHSFFGTLAVARMVETHKRRGTWNTKVDRLIALTEFAKRKFVEGGIDEDRIVVKGNATPAIPRPERSGVERRGALYVGRLSEEKGIRSLLSAWERTDYPLRLAGDGPLAPVVAQARRSNVEALGRLDAEQVQAEMHRAAFLVLPSIWYEMFPVTLIEAFGSGLPVLASRVGGIDEIVRDGVTGLLFNADEPADLAAKAAWAASHPDEMAAMGRAARAEYEKSYTPGSDYARLMHIYDGVRRGRVEQPAA